MYDDLVKRLRYCSKEWSGCGMCALSSDCVLRVGLLTQAADAIEELSKPKWIPVTERLPETRTRCVTISRDGDYGLGIYTTDFGWMFSYYMSEVTHWMPLPEPPEERLV